MVQHLYTWRFDHHIKFSNYLSLWKIITILSTTFSVLYITSSWLTYFIPGGFYLLLTFTFFSPFSHPPQFLLVETESMIMAHWLYAFAWAAVTKYHQPYHQPGGLNNRNFLSHGPAIGSPQARGWHGWLLPRPVREGYVPSFSPWLIDDCLLPMCLHTSSSMCACVQISPFHKDAGHIWLEPTLMTSF